MNADYVVAGGGTAGCVIASRLSRAGYSVILLEAGTDEHTNPLITSPVAAPRLHHTDLEWNYQTVSQPQLNDRQIYNCGGRVLSGSSAVNYGMWVRGDAADFNDWARQTGDKSWGYSGLLPYFRRVETCPNSANPDQHGMDGPMKITSGQRSYPLREQIHAALHAAGHVDNVDPNDGQPVGIGAWSENWHDHTRQPSGQVYPLEHVRVRTSSTVTQILLDESEPPRAVGVRLASNEAVYADKEVLVTCGDLRSPQLLMLSGIGPSETLHQHGIPVAAANEAIGEHFHDHVSLIQFWRLAAAHTSEGKTAGHTAWTDRPEAAQGLPLDFVTTLSFAPGLLEAAAREDGGVSDQALTPPGRAHAEMIFAYTLLGRGNPVHSAPLDGTHISSAVLLLLPTSRGRISLASADPTDGPLIDPAYQSTAVDRAMLRHGVREMVRVAERLVEAGVLEGETLPEGYAPLSADSSTDDEIDQRIRAFAATMYHPAGSAALGAALDTDLRVKGVKGLRVCDASVFPSAVAGHLQHTVYAVAEKAVDSIIKAAAAAQGQRQEGKTMGNGIM